MSDWKNVLPFDEFAAKYCERQEQTPEGLREVLQGQVEMFHPLGWFMLECVQMDSAHLGSLVILPYGPNNTYKSPPERPVSPRGLASDMSVVCAILLSESL